MKVQDLPGTEYDLTSLEPITYQQFKEYVAEFFRMKKTATDEGAKNGVKAIGIYYLSLKANSRLEAYEAQLLYEMVWSSVYGENGDE